MAELSHAMQAAAEHARGETMSRFEAEAKAVVEEIHASATTEVADLRRMADDDVAAIRDWSKAEIARIREETDSRVAARKAGLDAEMEAHAATVQARAERVTAVVAAFESEMGAFFARLNAEEDPTRIATMAETMPDSPSLEDVVGSIASSASVESAPSALADPIPQPEGEPGSAFETETSAVTGEVDFAAAEAEALSFDGDLGSLDDVDDEASATEDGTNGAEEGPAEPVAELGTAPEMSNEQATTRVVVVGLISVASIANFKRSLSRIGGVWSIGVSSGPNGEFVFSVSHNAGLLLASEIVAMPTFKSQLTAESEGEIQVSAQDRDAAD
jgi:hypothetical protein